jgi:hypothetical protein
MSPRQIQRDRVNTQVVTAVASLEVERQVHPEIALITEIADVA